MMNPAITAAMVAASGGRQGAQQTLLQKLTAAKAFEPSTAVQLPVEGAEESALTELVGLSIVRPLGSGRYYLDRDRQRERAAQGGWIAMVILLGVGSALASFIALAAL